MPEQRYRSFRPTNLTVPWSFKLLRGPLWKPATVPAEKARGRSRGRLGLDYYPGAARFLARRFSGFVCSPSRSRSSPDETRAIVSLAVATSLGCVAPARSAGRGVFAQPTELAPTEELSAAESSAPTDAESGPPPEFYTVASYDEQRDPAADLAATVQRAQAEHKLILLQVGGEWCGWCHRISKYLETNPAVRGILDEHYLLMKVTYPGPQAEAFLANYPEVKGYPHFFVLDQEGTFLHSQDTSQLEKKSSYDQQAFSDFLTSWIP